MHKDITFISMFPHTYIKGMKNVELEQILRLENTLDLMNELSNIALKCATCRRLFKEVVEFYRTNGDGGNTGNTGPR